MSLRSVCLAVGSVVSSHPESSINERANEIRDSLASYPEVVEVFTKAAAAGLASMNSEQRQAFLEDAGAFRGVAISPQLQTAVDELAADELLLANDDLQCSDPILGQQIRIEFEQRFVDEPSLASSRAQRFCTPSTS